MNEGQTSVELVEVLSQGASTAELSNTVIEVVNQSSIESPAEVSNVVIEVVEQVPRSRPKHLPTLN